VVPALQFGAVAFAVTAVQSGLQVPFEGEQVCWHQNPYMSIWNSTVYFVILACSNLIF
jgi:hypothetical protein